MEERQLHYKQHRKMWVRAKWNSFAYFYIFLPLFCAISSWKNHQIREYTFLYVWLFFNIYLGIALALVTEALMDLLLSSPFFVPLTKNQESGEQC